MPTIKEWVLVESNGDPVLGIVLGTISQYTRKTCPHIPIDYPEDKLLSWEEELPWIEYEFSDGYGSEQCFPIVAWTKNRVIAISCYDGSTAPFSLPRNPCDTQPFMPGGG